MSSTQVKNQVRNCGEGGFDTLQRKADVVTFPLAPLDGTIHGTPLSLSNWLLDQHPKDGSRGRNCQPQPQCYPAQPHHYHQPPPPQGYPGYSSHRTYEHVNMRNLTSRGRYNNGSMEDDNFGGF